MLKGTLVERLKNVGVAQANESKSNHSDCYLDRHSRNVNSQEMCLLQKNK